jgi:NitT/TauT family transport system substrate-binding protein
MMRINVIILTFFWLIISLASQAQSRKVVFTPHWLPQAQFAGFYVAQDQGFYKDAGIEVEIIHPSASVNAFNFLKEEKADVISLFLIAALDAVQKGTDLVNIAQLSQHSALMFITKKSSGIENLNDFEGRKIGIWRSGFKEVPQAMLESNNIHVEWIPILSTANLFLLGGIDVMTVMWYNEYHQVYLSGINFNEMNTFFMSDYGFNVPEDGLYVLPHTLDAKREDLAAFVEAGLRGWEYAAQNQEYTVDLVVHLMREANIPSNHAHQRWMLDKILQVHDRSKKGVQPTQLHPDDFEKAAGIIQNLSKKDFSLDYQEFFQPVLRGLNKPGSP